MATASQAVFDADHQRLNRALVDSGSVITFADGWRGIDSDRCPPRLLSAYQLLMQYGYANGLLP